MRQKTHLRLSASFVSILVAGVISLTIAPSALRAENIALPTNSQQGSISKPRKGISKNKVQSRPNGDPAIYYWEYPEYTVYFEGNIVIHSVSKNKSLKAH